MRRLNRWRGTGSAAGTAAQAQRPLSAPWTCHQAWGSVAGTAGAPPMAAPSAGSPRCAPAYSAASDGGLARSQRARAHHDRVGSAHVADDEFAAVQPPPRPADRETWRCGSGSVMVLWSARPIVPPRVSNTAVIGCDSGCSLSEDGEQGERHG